MCLAAGMVMVAGTLKAGPKWELGEDSSMQLSFLGQVHYLHDSNAEQER